jgi:hypothetical protein
VSELTLRTMFLSIDWYQIDHQKNNLYISSPWNIPNGLIGSKKQKYFIPFLNQSSGLYAISEK